MNKYRGNSLTHSSWELLFKSLLSKLHVIQQSFNVKSHLGTKNLLLVIMNSVLSGYVLKKYSVIPTTPFYDINQKILTKKVISKISVNSDFSFDKLCMIMCIHGCLKLLFIDFLTKTSYFTSQEVGNPVQRITNVELSKFQPILQNSVTFVESLFTLKPLKVVYWWFWQIQTYDKMRALFIFQIIDYALNIDYVVWFVLQVINKILLMARCFICINVFCSKQ